MAKILKDTVSIVDCEYSFYVKTCIRKGVQAFKAVKCCNWYTIKRGAISYETHDANKEVVMGTFDTLEDAKAFVDGMIYRYVQRTLTASN